MKRFAVRKYLQSPSPSLRAAFWSMILASGLYWAVALLIGTMLLSSCSGSIFSEGDKAKPAPSAATPAPAPEARVQDVQTDDGTKNNKGKGNKKKKGEGESDAGLTDGPGRQTDVVEKNPKAKVAPPPAAELPDTPPRARVNPATLPAFAMLFPDMIGQLTAGKKDEKLNEVLAKLRVSIHFPLPTAAQIKDAKDAGYTADKGRDIRSMVFVLKDGKGKILDQDKFDFTVDQRSVDNKRFISASGYLKNDGRKLLVSLTMTFDGRLLVGPDSTIADFIPAPEAPGSQKRNEKSIPIFGNDLLTVKVD